MISSASAFLRGLGFVISEISFDGRIHRTARELKTSSKSGWYIAWSAPFPLVVAGDWRTGEKWQWSEKGDVSPRDQKKLRRAMRRAMESAEEERQRRRANSQIAAKIQFEAGNPSPFELTAYQERKGLTQMFGAVVFDGDLLVPMRDWRGELWGIQTIEPNGRKMFMSGQRAKGCFHMIGDGEQIAICEGFATGASVHMATGLPVACAFSAGNLGPVAAAVRLKYPRTALTICADNDHKTPGNPGLTEATLVAHVFSARLAIPTGAGTDFNDMALASGLDAVANAVMGAKVRISMGVDKSVIAERYKHWTEAAG